MTDRQRRLVGTLLLVLGVGIASTQALLTSCSAVAAGPQAAAAAPVMPR
jgi:hypothetical protein